MKTAKLNQKWDRNKMKIAHTEKRNETPSYDTSSIGSGVTDEFH